MPLEAPQAVSESAFWAMLLLLLIICMGVALLVRRRVHRSTQSPVNQDLLDPWTEAGRRISEDQPPSDTDAS